MGQAGRRINSRGVITVIGIKGDYTQKYRNKIIIGKFYE